ncbi:class I SAM-dependent methyltransferase [Rhodococcus sp. IEGM 1408]|uniref:class I SAM-dependent methyltransferase n=1 Tax=Rhodococcus sp. IEGM 1408 TaxID=3082220 RepID=UPI002954AF4C|nr:class I SAM-dependent methyltransferase [Rhodococcus sp. IEGM 1408]MDV8002544.1 class I SAM-dependent methyltransferase [Rhodococcus sp. IEGM 1408]
MPCRGCGSERLDTILDLGRQPAADFFPPADSPVDDPTHPLAMALCPSCALAQLAEDDTVTEEPRGVEPLALIDQAVDAVDRVSTAGWFEGRSTVREFGSPHGGSWLGHLGARGLQPVDEKPADVVVDCFGIMHSPDQRAAFADRRDALAPGGVLLLQFHSLATIVDQGQWNALRHGHFAYYSMTALRSLLRGCGLTMSDLWSFDLYGGTYLVAATADPGAVEPERVQEILAEEHRRGLHTVAGTSALQHAADANATRLRQWLEDSRRRGHTVAAYGAASRAVALLARAGITRDLLVSVADASPGKHGRRMPGTDIPIVSPATLVASAPDAVLLTVPDLLLELERTLPELAGRWVVDPVD